MTFEEIFEKPGLYRADGFDEGVCFEIKASLITDDLELFINVYKKSVIGVDLFPVQAAVIVYANLFKKDYKKVLTKQSLFN